MHCSRAAARADSREDNVEILRRRFEGYCPYFLLDGLLHLEFAQSAECDARPFSDEECRHGWHSAPPEFAELVCRPPAWGGPALFFGRCRGLEDDDRERLYSECPACRGTGDDGDNDNGGAVCKHCGNTDGEPYTLLGAEVNGCLASTRLNKGEEDQEEEDEYEEEAEEDGDAAAEEYVLWGDWCPTDNPAVSKGFESRYDHDVYYSGTQYAERELAARSQHAYGAATAEGGSGKADDDALPPYEAFADDDDVVQTPAAKKQRRALEQKAAAKRNLDNIAKIEDKYGKSRVCGYHLYFNEIRGFQPPRVCTHGCAPSRHVPPPGLLVWTNANLDLSD